MQKHDRINFTRLAETLPHIASQSMKILCIVSALVSAKLNTAEDMHIAKIQSQIVREAESHKKQEEFFQKIATLQLDYELKMKQTPLKIDAGEACGRDYIDIENEISKSSALTLTKNIGSAVLKDPVYTQVFVDLVYHESSFNADNVSPTYARGLTQLTTWPCKSMIAPGEKKSYQTELNALIQSGVFQSIELPDPVRGALMEWNKKKISWETLIGNLWTYRMDANVNLILGSLFFSKLLHESDGDKTIHRLRNLKGDIDFASFQMEESEFNHMLNIVEKNPHTKKSIGALGRYNGSSSKSGLNQFGDIEERDVYVLKMLPKLAKLASLPTSKSNA